PRHGDGRPPRSGWDLLLLRLAQRPAGADRRWHGLLSRRPRAPGDLRPRGLLRRQPRPPPRPTSLPISPARPPLLRAKPPGGGAGARQIGGDGAGVPALIPPPGAVFTRLLRILGQSSRCFLWGLDVMQYLLTGSFVGAHSQGELPLRFGKPVCPGNQLAAQGMEPLKLPQRRAGGPCRELCGWAVICSRL